MAARNQQDFKQRQFGDRKQDVEQIDHIISGHKSFIYDKDKIGVNEILKDYDNKEKKDQEANMDKDQKLMIENMFLRAY